MAERTVRGIYEMAPVVPMPPGYFPANVEGLPDPEVILGIELEIEQWHEAKRGHCLGFNYENDGSLRNNGIEGISMPVPAKFMRNMLNGFFEMHGITEDFYSDRCSTHVHMNVQECTVQEVKVICLLYQIFERLLFKYVGHERDENIFCVPWHQSGLTATFVDKLQRNFDAVARNWVKYSALNLLPMRDKGTIEFRHLHGTCDVNVIMQWVRYITHLYAYAKKTSYKALTKTLLEMNTISNYDLFIMDVFGADAPSLMVDNWKADLNVGVVDAKLMVMKTPKSQPRRDLDDLIAEMANNPFLAGAPEVARRPARAEALNVEAVAATADALRFNWPVQAAAAAPADILMIYDDVQVDRETW